MEHMGWSHGPWGQEGHYHTDHWSRWEQQKPSAIAEPSISHCVNNVMQGSPQKPQVPKSDRLPLCLYGH